MSHSNTLIPPLPGDEHDSVRRTHTRFRRRMLSGHWETDLEDAIQQHFGPIRTKVTGKPDLSTNVPLSMVNQLSKLYIREPKIMHEDGDELIEPLLSKMDEAGLWAMMTRHMRMVLGLRDSLIRVVWTEDGSLQYRLVTPDMVHAESPADNPEQPHSIVEARLRVVDGKDQWTWDVYDLSDPDNPVCKVLLPEDKKTKGDEPTDITEMILGASDLSGGNYPFVSQAGEPVLPYVMYHAEWTGSLFDAFESKELYDGGLNVAAYRSFWGHLLRDCAHAQKYTVDAFVRGTTSRGQDFSSHDSIVTDPASLLQLRGDGQGSAQVGQWTPSTDPEKMLDAIVRYEQSLSVHFDMGPNDFQRSDAESGYAIALKRESVREKQRIFEPVFRRSDLQLIHVSAVMCNTFSDDTVPEDGYAINYPGLPETAQEIDMKLQKLEKLQQLKLASRVDSYLSLNPGMSREQAVEALQNIDNENRLLGNI